jgi:hypothetical protein
MSQPNDLSRSLVALDPNSSIIAVIEMSQSSWLVAGMLPGIERQPRKKLETSPEQLLAVLHAGGMRRSGPAALSRALRLLSRPAATGANLIFGGESHLAGGGDQRRDNRRRGMDDELAHGYRSL